jgi:guanylate kinase
MLYVVSGPSGSGKSTLCKMALSKIENLSFSISHTTRPRRKSELHGRDYYFISEQQFKKMIDNKDFIEWAIVHGNYYGTSKKEIEEKASKGDVLLDIDVQGAIQVRSKFKNAIFIFIMPPSYNVLKRRIINRGNEKLSSIEKRLTIAREEIKYYKDYDYLIINDELDKAVKELVSIIISQRCAQRKNSKEMEKIIATFKERK